MYRFKNNKGFANSGQIIIPALVFGCIAIIVITALLSWASLNLKLTRQAVRKEQALQIAEAGNDYYRWHLAHAKTDYKDGTGVDGPYVHEFKDKNGNVLGQFSLEITAPSLGSTVTTIKSSGQVVGDTATERHIRTMMAIPTIAKFAVASNSEVRFGAGTEIFGPIHSNGGIRFDGLAHNIVSSSKQSYLDPDSPNDTSFGVHTHISPADPTVPPSPLPLPAIPSRPDVFVTGRQLSVPAVDFAGLTPDLQTMKTDANTSGIYLAPSGKKGYHLVLKNNNTVDIYKVTALTSPASGCSNQEGSGSYWGTWTISTETFVRNSTIPSNGLIFVEDDTWVDGNVNNSRLTIAAARFPDVDSTRASIIINNNLTYTNYGASASSGSSAALCNATYDVIGLIAQRNINIGLGSANDLRVDAALIAQYGRVGRYYYNRSYCGSNSLRNSITLYGMIASNTRYGFSWICSGTTHCSGYTTRNINYDSHLLYCAPPDFPLTSDQYETISWEEVR
ncbi:MAG: hypothetical protein Q7S57_00945 [bacterium]|nr:hypothetical protein [bacterium]